MSRTASDLEHEIEQIVGAFSPCRGPAAPSPVCSSRTTVPYFRSRQVITFLRVVEEKASGHDGYLRWTAGNVLGATHANLVSTVIEPEFVRGRPDLARDTELVGQLTCH